MSTESFSPERHEQTGVSPDIRFITDLEGVLDLTYQAEPNQFIYLSSDMAPPIRSFGIRVEGSNEAFGPYYFRGEAHMLPAEDKDAYLEQAFHNFAESREARSVDNEEMPTYIYRSNGDKIYIVYLDPQTQDIGLISCGTYQEGVDLTQQAQNALHHGIDDENNALVDFLAEQKQLLVELYRSFGLAVKPQRLIIAPCETGDKHEAKPGRKKVLFSDLAGLREVKEQLREILLALQHPEVLQLWGAERPNGILLHGPGGTGKTTLVEAFSNEAGAELITVKANEVYDSLMGQSEKGFMAVINRVLAATRPTILFFDEIDAFLRPRAGGAYTNVVGLYKQEIGRITERNPNVVLIAASNEPDNMDETLLRAGRFDLKIYVAKPDDEEREEIFAELMGKYIEAAPRRTVFDLTQIGLAALVAETEGMAHVDIVTILRKLVAGRAVAEIRARSIPSAITENDILEMIRKHRQG